MSQTASRHRSLMILCFALVYFFWGSTYLGIDIAVERIPPALMCGVRFLIAGAIMLGYCVLRGQSIRYGRREMVQLATVGILLLMGGNLTLSYAEQYVPTGLSALLVASIPLWVLVLDPFLIGRHRIAPLGLAGLGLGVVGLLVLLWPQLTQENALHSRVTWHALSLLGGSFSWALGSVLAKRWHQGASLSAAGWQITFAGLANFTLALVLGDFGRAVWTARGLGAVAYLVVCGSLIGYTSYLWLLGHVPTSKVSTYAYVNPVIAVFLGWLILQEPVDRYIAVGTAIIVAAVVMVTSAKVHAKIEELPTVEAVGD
jgi:drug/metabolite transporter (DMT)-like permease